MADDPTTDVARLTDAEREQRCRREKISHEHYAREDVERIVAARVTAARAQAWDEGAFYGLGWPAALGYALMASNPYQARDALPTATEDADGTQRERLCGCGAHHDVHVDDDQRSRSQAFKSPIAAIADEQAEEPSSALAAPESSARTASSRASSSSTTGDRTAGGAP